MKTILEVSLQEASKAQVAISDSSLRSELTQTSTNIWELPIYDMSDGYECDGDEELKDEIREVFTMHRIPEGEYWFNDEEKKVFVEDCIDDTMIQKEIKVIESLFEMDGYFADSFKDEKDMIISNIKNDFPLLCRTKLDLSEHKLLSGIQRESKVLKSQLMKIKKEIADLHQQKSEMVNFLIEQAEKWSASDLREKTIEMIGEKEYIHRKIEKGFNLWEADRKLLIEILKA